MSQDNQAMVKHDVYHTEAMPINEFIASIPKWKSEFKKPTITFRHALWQTKEGDVLVKEMDTTHIRNTYRTIKYGRGQEFCGKSSKEWLDIFKSELQYRDQVADVVLKRVPGLFEWSNKLMNPEANTFSTKTV